MTSNTFLVRMVHNDGLTLDDLMVLLKKLAVSDSGPSIRLKLKGEEWPAHFSQVLVFSRHAMLLAHIPSRTVVNVPDLRKVAAFELDKACISYRAHCVYNIPESPSKKNPIYGLLHARYTI